MAITRYDYLFWKQLRDNGQIPPEPNVLELGQANWYGDLHPDCLLEDVQNPSDLRLLKTSSDPFVLAEIFYSAILRPTCLLRIDLHGTQVAKQWDLNGPIPDLYTSGMFQSCGVVINTGTAEHIFNQAQFFQTAHDACETGGIMVHFLPCWGWLDHGFYNYHPTFVADLAAANGYEIVQWWLYDLAADWCVRGITRPEAFRTVDSEKKMTGSTMHAVCYRKTTDNPFRLPQQGYYQQNPDPAVKAAWHDRDWRADRLRTPNSPA